MRNCLGMHAALGIEQPEIAVARGKIRGGFRQPAKSRFSADRIVGFGESGGQIQLRRW